MSLPVNDSDAQPGPKLTGNDTTEGVNPLIADFINGIDPIQTSRRVSNKLQFARSPHRVTPDRSCDILWV
jgi:hypothetical protein